MNQPVSTVFFLKRYFLILAILIVIAFGIAVPYSVWWLYASGDAAVERAVAAQAKGEFAIFGSGLSQDFVDYKLQLYAAKKPEIAAVGSSRVMQFRAGWFNASFLNMGGVAGNLAVLRSTLDAMLKIHKPKAVILGLDFWWFLPQWEADPFKEVPPTSGSYNYSLESLKKPFIWLMDGKLAPKEFFAPVTGLFGNGFKKNRFGIMAQQTDEGFGPDGSWYYSSEITGAKPPFDFQFNDTIEQAALGIKAFYHAKGGQIEPSEAHLDAFAEIWCKLRSRNIQTFVFIAPLSNRVLAIMKKLESSKDAYPHLFKLEDALRKRGIEVMNFTDPFTFGSNDCEFVDGFHGGEITYGRLLLQMAKKWPALEKYVNMNSLEDSITKWSGFAASQDNRVTDLPEIDFNKFGCKKAN